MANVSGLQQPIDAPRDMSICRDKVAARAAGLYAGAGVEVKQRQRMHATAFLKAPEKQPIPGVVVLAGTEGFLKQGALRAISRLVLGEGDELGLTRLAGPATDLKTVVDSLLTVSMWSPKQVVLVEDADPFVSEYRDGLERYLARPAKKSVLVLDVRTWPSNTRLAKKVVATGLPLECTSLKGVELLKWLGEQSQSAHGKKLERDAAQLLVELVGPELGMLDQELAKLAAYVGEAPTIPPTAVEKLVGGWKTETTWKMLDAVRDGRLDVGLELLDKLLTSGEHSLKLLGGINFVFRPIAQAVELSRQGTPLNLALSEAGVKPFAIQAVQNYLRRVTRAKAERLFRQLLQADLDLKGASQLPDRAIVERLLIQLSGKA